MARAAGPIKTTISLEPETVDYLDAIAESFEGFVSRGELVDMITDYIAENELEDDVFGSEDEEEEADEEDEDEEEAAD